MEVIKVFVGILTLIGALGLFLFGMKLMSESLQKVAGNKMRVILAAMTNNRIKGIFTGFLVTCTIQSSSATTVMIVSFVNAGLLSLIGAIGVIMGANIGTTITAWIISILGFKVSMYVLALPIIGLGFPLYFSRNSTWRAWGEFFIGFAILFIGLNFLKESVPDLQNNNGVLEFISKFSDLGFLSILIFVLIGSIITVLIQSSSATMALTLVMCYNGLIPFEMGAAMVLGENIGTTITANIAASVANISAKRTARAHFLFNMFGVIWILLIFNLFLRGIDSIVEHNHSYSLLKTTSSMSDFENVRNLLPIGLALFHSAFNIINTLLLVGFAPLIAKIATKMVPSKDEEDEEFRLKYINTGLLSTSELSLIQAHEEISFFGKRLSKMLLVTCDLLAEHKSKKIDYLLNKIEKYEQITDNIEIEIAEYLTKVSEGDISRDNSKRIRAMLKIIDDMESIGDVCYQMSKVINNKNKKKIKVTDEQSAHLNKILEMVKTSMDIMNHNLEVDFNKVNPDSAHKTENEINEYRNKLRQQNVEDLKEKKYKYKSGAFYSDIFSLSEKMGDYIINISEAIEEYLQE